jgi:NitT/TauT family transport system substrate-binding protein
MNARAAIRGPLLVALSAAITSCGSAAQASPTPAIARVALAASWNSVSGDQVPLWLAKDGGFFERNALDVDVRYIASTTSMAALLSGETQIAHVGGSEVLSAVAGGADLVVVAVPGPVYPFSFFVPASVKTAADLKGQKIGVTGVGSSTDVATRVGLPRVGLVPDKDVSVISVGSVTNLTSALLSGAVAGGMGHPPDSVVLEARGFHVLFDLAKENLPFANNTIAMQRSYLAAHRDVVQRYVDAIVQAIAREKRDKAATVTVMKKYFESQDDAAMAATWEYYAKAVRPDLPYPRPEQFADPITELAKKNDKVKQLDLAKIIDPSFVQSAADRGLARP